MLKKFLLTAVVFTSLTFGGSLTELLTSVQNIVTDYETSGKAIEEPYIYTKLSQYYKYGVLYASYGLEKQAVKLLELASCTGAPIDCKPYMYFLTNLSIVSYKQLRKKEPALLAKTEAAYDAYADWWIKKYTTSEDVYREFKNLENILRYDFFNRWKVFIQTSPKPIYFVIPRDNYSVKDRFLIFALYTAYIYGWIKNITFYGSFGDFEDLIKDKYQMKVKFIKSNKYPAYDLIEVY